MERISKGGNTMKPSTYLLNPRNGLKTDRRQACMVATQVGMCVYIAAVAINAREVERWCTHHHVCPVGVVNAQEGWRGGEVEHRMLCMCAAVVINAPERGGGPLQI